MPRPAGILSRIVLTLLQIVSFCALFLVGGYWAEIRLALQFRAMQQRTAPPPLLPLWKLHINASLDYVANGLVYAAGLLVIILLFEALRRRLRPWAALTLLAFLLSFLASLVARSGFVPLSNP